MLTYNYINNNRCPNNRSYRIKRNDTWLTRQDAKQITQERHQGAATKLLEQAISFAKEQECQQIILSTIATYQSALNLYQKMGFTELDPNKLPENIKIKARTIYLGLTLQEPENSHA